MTSTSGFEEWVAPVRARLSRAFAAAYGLDRGQEALSEAMAFAWEHFDTVSVMANPGGCHFLAGSATGNPPRRAGAAELKGRPISPPGRVSCVGEPSDALNERAARVVELAMSEPWFTFHVDHDDGIERSELQKAVCLLARVTSLGHDHSDDDGCLEYMDQEDLLDLEAAKRSAAASPNAECRQRGHAFPRPHEFRQVCSRCGCVRILRGNPSRFVYEYLT